MNSNLVTIKQALLLKDLGFNEPTVRYAFRFSDYCEYRIQQHAFLYNYNSKYPRMLSIPTVDEAIDWLRRQFHVIIYDSTEPYVCPTSMKILYAYRVKFCNVHHGWNSREYLGCSKWSTNSYGMKRQALWIALRYIVKKKKDESRRKNTGRKRRVYST